MINKYKLVYVLRSLLSTDFERQVSEAKDSLHFRIETYINALRASQGLFAANQNLDRNQWKTFVKSLDLPNLYPGINGMGFARYVPKSQKTEFEQQVRQDTRTDKNGYANFKIKPTGDRSVYFVIEYADLIRDA